MSVERTAGRPPPDWREVRPEADDLPGGVPWPESPNGQPAAGWPGLPDYDLGQLAAKGIEPPELIAGGMLYPASVHCIAGPPGGGKTTLMAWWMLQHLRAGGSVMLLDEESGPEQAAEKFLDLGATPEELSPPRFTYIPFPARCWTVPDREQLFDRIRDRRPGIIGLDSTAAFLAIAGLDENAAADITRFWATVLMPCAREYGAAVAAVDHTIKSGEHSGYGRGSGAKKAASDVQYIVEVIKPFNREQDGILKLTTAPGKDRRGYLATGYRVHVRTGALIALDITAWSGDGPPDEPPAKRKLREALAAVANGTEPVAASTLVDWIARTYGHGLSRKTRSAYLNELEEEGFAVSFDMGSGREKRWLLTRNPVTSFKEEVTVTRNLGTGYASPHGSEEVAGE
jgi:AAA domain